MVEGWPGQLLFGSLPISRSKTREDVSVTQFCRPCPGGNTNALNVTNVMCRKISLSPSTLLLCSPLQSTLKTTAHCSLTNYHVPAEPWSMYQHYCALKPYKISRKAFNTDAHSFALDAVAEHDAFIKMKVAWDILNRHFQTEHAAPQLRHSFEYYQQGQSAAMQSYYFLNQHQQFTLTTLWEQPNSTCTDSMYVSAGTEMDNAIYLMVGFFP